MEQSLEIARHLVQSSAVLDGLMDEVRALREAIRLAETVPTEVKSPSAVTAAPSPTVEIRT